MKKKKILIIIIILLMAGGGFWFFKKQTKADPAMVIASRAQYGFIAKSVTATGAVEPVDTVSVGAQVSGLVIKVYADFNSQVKKGQLIAQVDPSIMQAQLQEAKASLATAQSNLQFQKSTYDRQSQLFNAGAISKADYQTALNQYTSAQAAINNASGQLMIAQKNLGYTKIYSPINGTVLNRNVSVGQTIAASLNAPVLFVIAKDLTKMQVNAAVDEADIGNINSGQDVTFTVDAFPDIIFKGKVQQIYLHPSVSANVVTYTTLIDVDNNDRRLKPGMTASINIYEQEDSSALLIPSRALNFKPDEAALKKYIIVRTDKDSSHNAGNASAKKPGPAHNISSTGSDTKRNYVWLLSGDSLMEKQIITGMNDDTHVKVIRGLSEGDEVVTGISNGSAKTHTETTEQSPFLPKMPQRQSGTQRK